MSNERVQELQGSDRAIAAIQSRPAPIHFHWLRETFKRDHDLKGSLDYGRAILDDVDQLDQYLYTYGKMIQSQWETLLGSQKADDEPIRIIDYGCGQGLAGLIISDCLGEIFNRTVKEVILIEPSEVALVRAEAVYRSLFTKAKIVCRNKKLDDIESDYFCESEMRTLHLFSNILDIPRFNISHVFNSVLTNGDHTILAVSHNRAFAGGAARVRGIQKEIEKTKYREWVTVRSSSLDEFECGDGGKFAAISWVADLGIDHG